MGLGDAPQVNDSSSSSGPSGSGSKSGGFPKFREFVPLLALIKDETGYHLQKRPREYRYYEVKKKKSEPYEYHSKDDEIVKMWTSPDSLKMTLKKWDTIRDDDFWITAQEEPEMFAEIIDKLESVYFKGDDICTEETCPVCREKNNISSVGVTMIHGRRVCKRHTAQDMVESGFLSRNRPR